MTGAGIGTLETFWTFLITLIITLIAQLGNVPRHHPSLTPIHIGKLGLAAFAALQNVLNV